VIIFGLVWFLSKKSNQTKKKLKKPKLVQADRFRFGFLGQKPVWLGFFRFGFGSTFSVLSLSNRTELVSFFKMLIGFLLRFGFLVIFFQFSQFN